MARIEVEENEDNTFCDECGSRPKILVSIRGDKAIAIGESLLLCRRCVVRVGKVMTAWKSADG